MRPTSGRRQRNCFCGAAKRRSEAEGVYNAGGRVRNHTTFSSSYRRREPSKRVKDKRSEVARVAATGEWSRRRNGARGAALPGA